MRLGAGRPHGRLLTSRQSALGQRGQGGQSWPVGRTQWQVGCGGAGGRIGRDRYVGSSRAFTRSRAVSRKGDGFGFGPVESNQSAQVFCFLWICSLFLVRERMEGVGRWSLRSTGKEVRVEAVAGGAL